jgi:hypothetical protein
MKYLLAGEKSCGAATQLRPRRDRLIRQAARQPEMEIYLDEDD